MSPPASGATAAVAKISDGDNALDLLEWNLQRMIFINSSVFVA